VAPAAAAVTAAAAAAITTCVTPCATTATGMAVADRLKELVMEPVGQLLPASMARPRDRGWT
jgi:hypothetical protein